MGKEHIHIRRHKIKIRVESQWDSSFPADGHKASLKKVDGKAMIRNRYNRIPHTSPDTTRESNTNNQDCINPFFNKTIRHYYRDMKSNNIYTFPYFIFLPTTGHKSEINSYPFLLINKLALRIVQISLHAMFIMHIRGVLQKFVEKCCNLITVE